MKEGTPQDIVEQYKTVTGNLDQMFVIASSRTKQEFWRQDGVGSCAVVTNKAIAELGILDNEAGRLLIVAREDKDREIRGRSGATGCPYHRINHGCILGELKSPICVGYFDNPDEWENKFGIDADQLREEISNTLYSVLTGQGLEEPQPINEFVMKIKDLTAHIEQKPMLFDKS